jgi:hypothetical protein
MADVPPPEARGALLARAQQQLGMTLQELWVDYVAIGGDAPQHVLGGWLAGTEPMDDRDHDLVAAALNDRFVERGQDHPIPYSDASSG